MSEGQKNTAHSGEMTDENIRAIFREAGDFNARRVRCCGFSVYVYAIDGLVASGFVSDYVVKPIAQSLTGDTMQMLYDRALDGGIYNAVANPCSDLNDAAVKLVNGFTVVLFPGVGGIAFETRTPQMRNPGTPEVENTVKGPKDSFVETMRVNTSLVRRHLRSPDLRLYQTEVGRRSLTNVTVVWLEGITNPWIVQRLKDRLNEIDIDGMVTPAAVEEYVNGSRATAFPLLQYTERTDKFCQGILMGRVGLIVDGLPLAYLLPVDLGYLMESPEDRGKDYVLASCVRVLRYGALLLGLLLPGIYLAVITHHQDLLPLPLLQTILEGKKGVPFSSVAEVLGLLIAFELLQESGVHLPQAVGQSVSIIGGIVVGSAAVEAKLISSAALVVVSIAGICGFVLPNRDLADAVRVWRFLIALLAAVFGLTGVGIGAAMLIVHLLTLRSFGIPYIKLHTPIRRRLKYQKNRDTSLKPQDNKNQK
jgi:spore germination protein KA